MSFETFAGNPKIVKRLRSKLAAGRFPHGLIFAGPDGVGKRTCALMIAKALNCREREPDSFCGVCAQCRKIDAGTHPDVLRIGVEEEASEIKIAQIRQALQTLEMRPLEGDNKIFILDPANKMKPAAANALLKGLEEPPENSYFILLTDNLQELLPTVRSRCQSHHFTPLSLAELRGFEGDDLAHRWSRGSIGTLKTLDLAALRPRRAAILAFIETAARAKESDFRELLAASADLSRSKHDFGGHLEMMAVLLGDLLYLQEGVVERIVNVDLVERLKKLATELTREQLLRISEFLYTMETDAKMYVNRQILTDVFALAANESFRKLT